MIYALVNGNLRKALRFQIDDSRLKIEGMLSIRIKKTERSDTTNRHSSFIIHQFGSGLSGLGVSDGADQDDRRDPHGL
jgi:hypothetical protein